MLWPIFLGLGGLSERRDLNTGNTPSSCVVMATCKLCGRYVKLHKKGLMVSIYGLWQENGPDRWVPAAED